MVYVMGLVWKMIFYIYSTWIRLCLVYKPNDQISYMRSEAFMWHCRLSHKMWIVLKGWKKRGFLAGLRWTHWTPTIPACSARLTKAPFRRKRWKSKWLVGTSAQRCVCGSLSINAGVGYSYFVTFTDDFSWYGYVFWIRRKSKTFDKFKNKVENQFNKKIEGLVIQSHW